MRAKILRIAAATALFGLLAVPHAHADSRFSFQIGVGAPVLVAPAPVYVDGNYWQPGYYVSGGRWVSGYWVNRHYRDRWERDRCRSGAQADFWNPTGRVRVSSCSPSAEGIRGI